VTTFLVSRCPTMMWRTLLLGSPRSGRHWYRSRIRLLSRIKELLN